MVRKIVVGALILATISTIATAQTADKPVVSGMDTVEHLKDFQIIEFRRYTTKPGEREHFAKYFDTFFPEAFEQLGAIAFGQFRERKNPDGFTWLRGFHTKYDRAIVNGAFYYGPLWREHSKRINELLVDSDNVLLLRPWKPERSIPALPAVDPVNAEDGAQGVIVALVLAVKTGQVEELAAKAEPIFANYRAAGAREAGILVTADIPNNFPQLPVRTDGPYLVWLGIVKDDAALQTRLNPLLKQSVESLTATGLLRTAPEVIILDPTSRSRLRWRGTVAEN